MHKLLKTKGKLIGFFIGLVNKETKGKVSHEVIISELKKKLKN